MTKPSAEISAYLREANSLCLEYLSGDIDGSLFVDRFDEIAADRMPADLPEEIARLLFRFQTEFAFFVADPVARMEESSFYDSAELREQVRLFLHEL